MVHDLTANNDFRQGRSVNSLLGRIASDLAKARDELEELTLPYDEVVLTGTTFDRDHKRYVLDYESDQKNMCDCCGLPIKIRPWVYEENQSLCPNCVKWLEKESWFRQERVVKPWDIRDFERENAVDNVLLWD